MTMLMMGLAVIAASSQADAAAAISDPANRADAIRCESALARAAGGDLQSIGVESAWRSGSRTVLKGTIQVFLKPSPAPQGELSPTHIINAEMGHKCQLSGGKVVKATVQPIAN